jgi:hypothetical protein
MTRGFGERHVAVDVPLVESSKEYGSDALE